jgi:hypothetical protein
MTAAARERNPPRLPRRKRTQRAASRGSFFDSAAAQGMRRLEPPGRNHEKSRQNAARSSPGTLARLKDAESGESVGRTARAGS